MLGIAAQLNSVVERYVQGGQPAPAPAAPAATAPQQFDEDGYVSGAQMRQYAESIANRQNPDLQHVINANADMALDVVKREFADHFAKYGPEITANLASLTDKRAWTLDNLRKVVKFTLVDHVDDIANARASQIAANMEPTLRSTGAGGVPIHRQTTEHTLTSETLPSDWKERAAKAGLTEAALDEFCRGNDITREQWFKYFGKTAITEGVSR